MTPASASKPLKYFLRYQGSLREVYPLTKPSRDNGGCVLVEVCATGEILKVEDATILRYR